MSEDAQPNKPITVAKHTIRNNNTRTTRHHNRRDQQQTIRALGAQPTDTGTDNATPTRRTKTITTRNRQPANGDKPLSPGHHHEPDQGSGSTRKGTITGRIINTSSDEKVIFRIILIAYGFS